MKLPIFMLAASAAACSAGPSVEEVTTSAGQAIRNGDPVARGQFSGVGALRDEQGVIRCSGFMVGRSTLLTAAQCVRDPAASLEFALGQRRRARPALIVEHPQAESPDGFNLAYDIALVRLEKPLSRRFKRVARLGLHAAPIPVGIHATGVGFGESNLAPGARTSANFLVTQYIPGEGPIGVIFSDGFIEVVAGNAEDQMFCGGDVGGPLVYQDRVAGIASFRFVDGCADPGPGYYLSSSRLVPWVNDTLAEIDPPGACPGEDSATLATAGGGCQDIATGNVWSARGRPRLNQTSAAAYCDALSEAGRSDWRLPTLAELRALDLRRPELHGKAWSSQASRAYDFRRSRPKSLAARHELRPLCVRSG